MRSGFAATEALTEHDDSHHGFHNQVVLLRARRFRVVTFGLFAALGVALSSWIALLIQVEIGLAPGRYAPAVFLVVPLAILAGSRLFTALLDWRSFRAEPWRTLRRPTFAFQGGFVASALALVIIARAYQLDLLTFLDTFALAVPLGHAIGRLGCLCYGCCHGKPTTAPWAIVYTNPESKAVWGSRLARVPLHPTQLYSTLGNLALAATLFGVATTALPAGRLTGLYLLLGSLGRFTVELWRGIPVRRIAGLSPFQLVSLLCAAAGVAVLSLAPGLPIGPLVDGELLLVAARDSTRLLHLPALLFVLMFIIFGVQGPRVGKV